MAKIDRMSRFATGLQSKVSEIIHRPSDAELQKRRAKLEKMLTKAQSNGSID